MTQAFNYTRIQARCSRAITRAGQNCVIRVLGAETGDAWSPTVASPTLVDVIGMTYRPRQEVREGTLIDFNHLRMLVRSETGLNIQQADRVAVGVQAADVDANTVWYEITDAQGLAPGGPILFWELELRT